MKTVNRAAPIVRPREPYLRWAASLGWEGPEDAESLHEEVAIYLVPEDETGTREAPPVEEFFEAIFAAELEAWCTDEDQWPPKRDLTIFLEWFDVVPQSIVTDLGKGRLQAHEKTTEPS